MKKIAFIFTFSILLTAHSLDQHMDEYTLVLEARDPKLCMDLSEVEIVEDCFIRLSNDLEDVTVCDANPIPAQRAHCRILHTKDPNECQDLKDTGLWHCLTQAARLLEDQRHCQSIEDPYYEDRCYLELGKKSGDAKACLLIQSSNDLVDECYRAAAVTTGIPSHCNDIQTTSMKEACFRDLAEKNKDIEICEMIENKQGGRYAGCVLRTAIAAKNSSLCDRLESSEDCKTQVNGSLNQQKEAQPAYSKQKAYGILFMILGTICIVAGVFFVKTKS